MTVYRAYGDADRFECVSLAEQTRQPFSIYLFTLFIACLALPATTPLPLGEYPARAERLGWSVRVRRWLFLAAKLALILPLVYFASIDLGLRKYRRRVCTPSARFRRSIFSWRVRSLACCSRFAGRCATNAAAARFACGC